MTADDQTPAEGPDGGSQEASETPEQGAQAPEAGAQAPEAGAHAPDAGEQAPDAGEQAPVPGAEGAQSQPPNEVAAAAEDAPPEAGEQPQAGDDGGEEEEAREPAPRVKPSVPGAHLEVDIVPEGVDPLGRGEEYADRYVIEEEGEEEVAPVEEAGEEEHEQILEEPIATAAIDLAAGARYRATGKRKTAIARVTLRPLTR